MRIYQFRCRVRVVDSMTSQHVTHHSVEIVTQEGKPGSVGEENGPEVGVTTDVFVGKCVGRCVCRNYLPTI